MNLSEISDNLVNKVRDKSYIFKLEDFLYTKENSKFKFTLLLKKVYWSYSSSDAFYNDSNKIHNFSGDIFLKIK